MKVVMLISSFYPLVGGAERQAQRLSKELVKRGHEVIILTRLPNQKLNKTEMIDGIKVVRFKVLTKGKLAPVSFLVKSLFYIMKNKKKIDVVHAHSLSANGFIASLCTLLWKIPSISKIAGGGNEVGCEAKRMYVSGGHKRRRIRFMNKYLSRYIAISSSIKEDLISIDAPTNKVKFIPNGINIEQIKNKNTSREEYNLPINKKIFLYAGRLELVKGIDVLLEAWNNTTHDFKEKSQLLILGQGSFNIDKYLHDPSISVLGNVNNVSEYMYKSDYFLLPSRYEGISNALLEAIIHKMPVIASNAGGNIDIIDQSSGYLFDKEDDKQLTKIMESILTTSSVDIDKKIEKAYKKVINQYNLSNVCTKYEQLYSELINSR